MEGQKNEKHDNGDFKEEGKEGGIMKGIIGDLVEGRKIENLENETESDDKMMINEPGNGPNGGIISNIISKFVSPNQEMEENDTSGVHEKEENEEHTSGGVISDIISKFISPNQEVEENDKWGVHEKEENEEHKSGGVISDIFSKFVNPSPNHEVEENDKSVVHEKEENGEENEGHKSGGGNIIDNIVSHLPSSLTDDVDPPSDEASILIHSIIHD